MAREVEKWSGIHIRDGLLPKVNHFFRLLDPIITLSFSEIGSQTEWQTNGPDRNNHLHILACNVFYSTAPVCFVHKTFRSTSKSTKWLERFLCVCQPKCNKKTSSSAVTETPRDALCLSVVSFNSTSSAIFIISRTSASDLLLRKLNSVLFLFCSAYSLMRGGLCSKQTWTVTAIHYCSVGCTNSSSHRSDSHADSGRESRFVPTPSVGPRRNIAMMFGMENWNGVANRWWKNSEDTFIRVFVRQTDRHQTDRHRMTA